jgi:DNA-binding transcriptional LysR family regulator
VLFASPDYVARRGRPRTPRDLIKHDIVYESHRPSPMEWRFRTGRGKVVRLTLRFMATEVEAVLAAVKAGRGIGRTLSFKWWMISRRGPWYGYWANSSPRRGPFISLFRPRNTCRERFVRFLTSRRRR